MIFKYAILYVKSVTEAIEFYEQAFGFKRTMIHEAGDYGQLDTGSTILSFSSLALMENLGKNPLAANADKPSFELAFETDNVADALSQALTNGAKLVQKVEEMSWGQQTAYVNDNNGFLIEICSPIDH